MVFSRFIRLTVAGIGLLVWGCGITDGPNSTGLAFLEEQNLVIATDLKKVTIQYPVDSFWIESFEPSHINSSYLLLSNENGFEAKSRVGVYVPPVTVRDTNFTLEQNAEYTVGLFLTLGVKDPRTLADIANEKPEPARLPDYAESLAGHRVIVKTFFLDSVEIKYADEFGRDIHYKRRIGAQNEKDLWSRNMWQFWDDFPEPSDVTPRSARDTITLQSPEKWDDPLRMELVNAWTALQNRRTNSIGQWIFTELEIMPDDSLPFTVRYNTDYLDRNGRGMLELKNIDSLITDHEGEITDTTYLYQHLTIFSFNRTNPEGDPLARGFNMEHPNFRTRTPPNLLSVKSQGVHMILDRDKLMSALVAADPELNFTNDKGQNVNNYFIPMAEFSIPVESDSVFIENNDYLKLRLASILDTFPQVELEEDYDTGLPRRTLPVVDSGVDPDENSMAEYQMMHPTTHQVIDTMFLSYEKDNNHYKIIFEYAVNRHQNDTLEFALKDMPGGTDPSAVNFFEYTRRYASFAGIINLKFLFEPTAESISYSIYRENAALVEFNENENRETLDDDLPRFFHSSEEFLEMRSTVGMQRLINLSSEKHDVAFDFFLSAESGYTIVDEETRGLGVLPLSQIPLKLNDNELTIGITVYFYEL